VFLKKLFIYYFQKKETKRMMDHALSYPQRKYCRITSTQLFLQNETVSASEAVHARVPKRLCGEERERERMRANVERKADQISRGSIEPTARELFRYKTHAHKITFNYKYTHSCKTCTQVRTITNT
jgi:hypothetical protein